MSTTLFPELLPDTDRADDYTPLKKGDAGDDAGHDGDSDAKETELSGTYEPDSEKPTAEKPE